MNRFFALVRIGTLSLAAASISLSTGCGVDVSVGGTTGTGGQDSGSGGGSSNAVTGTGGATSSTGTGSGAVCGGFAGAVCSDDEYCDFPDNRCGATDGQGICKPRPEACDKNLFPTCGCDGQVHGNECDANSAGQDVSNMGSCQAPAGQFACGAHFCFQNTEYCTKFGSDVGSEPDTFSCKPVPAGCGATPTCACLSGVACGNMCASTNGGGLQVTCLGG